MTPAPPRKRLRRVRFRGLNQFTLEQIEHAIRVSDDRGFEKSVGMLKKVLARLGKRPSIGRGSLTEEEAVALDVALRAARPAPSTETQETNT